MDTQLVYCGDHESEATNLPVDLCTVEMIVIAEKTKQLEAMFLPLRGFRKDQIVILAIKTHLTSKRRLT